MKRDIYWQLEHRYQADFTTFCVFMVQSTLSLPSPQLYDHNLTFVLSGGGLAAVRQGQHGEHQG